MSKKIQLQIPIPCHEDWHKMTQVQQGRFCDSCEKKVVDFTGMNDEQVLAFFRKPTTGSVCGRFLNDQLNRDIIIPKKRIPWLKYYLKNNKFNPTIQLNMQLESGIVGLIVVDTVSKKDTALPSQRIVNDNTFSSFKLFPNPVQSGSILNIQWNKIESGTFVLQLITSSGQIVYSKEILKEIEVSVLNIRVPSVSSGTYFLHLTNKKRGMAFTKKINIQ